MLQRTIFGWCSKTAENILLRTKSYRNDYL